jgi:small subunit ribosomal protein S2
VPAVTMRELLEAGVHFGHQTRRWNPKMRRFIFAERSGLYLIDLQQTIELIETAHSFVRNVAERGGSVLFVGTKKQTQDSIRDEATRVGMPFVNHRWLGGLLTNHRTIQSRITRMHDLRRLRADGQLDLLPPKERMSVLRELEKLEINLGGVAEMRRLPQAVFVIDLKKEALAIREARRCNIPVIGLVDTNCDPDEATFVIPGNDDAIRSCGIVARVIADGIAEGQGVARAAAAEIAAAAEAAALAAEEAAAAEAAAAEAAAAEAADAAEAPEADAPEPAAVAPEA